MRTILLIFLGFVSTLILSCERSGDRLETNEPQNLLLGEWTLWRAQVCFNSAERHFIDSVTIVGDESQFIFRQDGTCTERQTSVRVSGVYVYDNAKKSLNINLPNSVTPFSLEIVELSLDKLVLSYVMTEDILGDDFANYNIQNPKLQLHYLKRN